MYEYKSKILRIVDGDTVDVDIDLGFGVWLHKERVRIMGIDTPESRTRDKVEKKFGLASKARLKELMPIGSIQILKTQIDKSGEDKKYAEENAPILKDSQNLLRKWEKKDDEVIKVWKKMNSWVIGGFNETLEKLDVVFDSEYFESETYLIGKEIVEKGLKSGLFFKKQDNSVWVDLTSEGLDEKILIRSDGTSVYMTQDLGTAYMLSLIHI